MIKHLPEQRIAAQDSVRFHYLATRQHIETENHDQEIVCFFDNALSVMLLSPSWSALAQTPRQIAERILGGWRIVGNRGQLRGTGPRIIDLYVDIGTLTF